ncbi:pleckstrin (PH) domain-containing protein [Tieghemostelium lacteum]|uniref:Pleckstrin (PH) domain-containing protein n=1 Tax=Tieghemostelium lacteum TaxID=361077 RepID=A0A151ZCK1_TIELA|nr:pleckstrin (PH) domain-containing protein [Tieghemostelium lacteum]|eukprot:KYQ91676.1 pleckstrin (PH) domain-containing protein [Tieghemostelium lacteum]
MDYDDIDKRKTAPPGVVSTPQPPTTTTNKPPPFRASSVINKSPPLTSLTSNTHKSVIITKTNSLHSSSPDHSNTSSPNTSTNNTNSNSENNNQNSQPLSTEDKKTPPKITPRSSSNQDVLQTTPTPSHQPTKISASPSTSSNSLVRASTSIESFVSELEDHSDVSDDESDETDEEEEEMHDNFLKDVIKGNDSVNALKDQERKELESLAGGTKFRVTRCFVGPVVSSGRQLPKPPQPNATTTTTTTTTTATTTTTPTPTPTTTNIAPKPNSPIPPQATSNATATSPTPTVTATTTTTSTVSTPVHQPSTHNNQQNRKTMIINPAIHRPLPPKKPLPPPPVRKTPPQQVKSYDDPKYQSAALKIQRVYRRYKLTLPYLKLKMLYRYRWNIIQEIVNTEKTYINTLNQLSTNFIEPLRKGSICNQEDVKFIFNGIDSILAINKSLLEGMIKVTENWTPYSCLGKHFSIMINFLRAYTDYVKNFDFVLQRIAQCSKDNKFSLFIAQAEEKCQPRARLESMLITPVQRIPRYVLLLQDLLKHTEESHPDFKDISESLEKMKNVAMQINDTKRQSDNSLKVVEVQNKLVGKFSNIVTAERRYVYEGCLFVGDTNAKSKKIYLFLFNDILIFAKPSSSAKLFNKTKFKFLKCEDLFPSPLLTDIPNNPIMQHCFEIVVQSVEMRFFAENQESKTTWLNQLQKVFSEIEKNQAKDELHINVKKAEEKAKDFKAYVGYQYAALKYKGTRGATLTASSLNESIQQQQNVNNTSPEMNGNFVNINSSNNNNSNNNNNNGTQNSGSLSSSQSSLNLSQSSNNSLSSSTSSDLSNSGTGSPNTSSPGSFNPPSLYRQATFHKMSYQTRMETIKDAEEKTQQLLLEEQNKQEKLNNPTVEDKMTTMKAALPNLVAANKPGNQTFGRSTIANVDEKKSKSSPTLNKIFSIGMSSSSTDKDKEKDKDKDKKKSSSNGSIPTGASKLAPQKSATNLKALNSELSASKQFNQHQNS